MAKFKVGDKVKLVSNKQDLDYPSNSVGKTFTIDEVHPKDRYNHGQAYNVKEDINGYVLYESDLELAKPKDMKNPTHLVIWEEDQDPCEFFESEAKAKEFIKELIEKTSVKKDSIILEEIKSAKKMKVVKNLKTSQYKI